jgi:hypothetical protein
MKVNAPNVIAGIVEMPDGQFINMKTTAIRRRR